MEPALNVLNRALNGESGAISFIEKTSSIYILDVTNSEAPKTYGCWDFLNQALNEVDRYEQMQKQFSQQENVPMDRFENHIKLLCSMSHKAARRSPESDRRLIGICLSNSSTQYHAGTFSQKLIEHDRQIREQVMGRIATMIFDFTFHRANFVQPQLHTSPFYDPLVIEGLCKVLSANCISHGPSALREMVIDWILPSVDNLPHLAVASVIHHLAIESMCRTAPAGIDEELQNILGPVIVHGLGPILVEALTESDCESNMSDCGASNSFGHDIASKTQRVCATSIHALERWCYAGIVSIDQLNQICNNTRVNITELISDALYFHVECIMDAAAEFIDTLLITSNLKRDPFIQQKILHIECQINANLSSEAQNIFLVELITAIGLQRFRFVERQNKGDSATCKRLARVAAIVGNASLPILRSHQLDGPVSGIVDLLLKAAAHPSINISWIALEVLPLLIMPDHNLSDHVVPILRKKVHFPLYLVLHVSNFSPSTPFAFEIDFPTFHQFREECLSNILYTCYLNNRRYFLELCAESLESLSNRGSSEVYDFEAVLFCLASISSDACNDALLTNDRPANKSTVSQGLQAESSCEDADMDNDVTSHNSYLLRFVVALTNVPRILISNPLLMAQLCKFISKYATWFAKSTTSGVLDSVTELALMAFKSSYDSFQNNPNDQAIISLMQVSPFAESATALCNILCAAPSHFTTPQALAALAGAWESFYSSNHTIENDVNINDREALCNGICQVLVSLPSEKWIESLNALSGPTIESLGFSLTELKKIEIQSENESLNYENRRLCSLLKRGANEVRLLHTMITTFNDASYSLQKDKIDPSNSTTDITNHPSVSIVRNAWPHLLEMAQKYSCHTIVSKALGELLVIVLAIGSDLALLKELCQMVSSIVLSISKTNESCVPIFHFVEEVLNRYGSQAEMDYLILVGEKKESASTNMSETCKIIEQLLVLSADVVLLEAANNEISRKKRDEQSRSQDETYSGRTDQMQIDSGIIDDSLGGILGILNVALQKATFFFLQLSGTSSGRSIFQDYANLALMSLGRKELDIVRPSMIFIKSIIDLKSRGIPENNDFKESVFERTVTAFLANARKTLIYELVVGALGNMPRELLNIAGELLWSVLQITPCNNEVHESLCKSLQSNHFRLGNDALKVSIQVLAQCITESVSSKFIVDFLFDLWDMHQLDDACDFVGGNVIKKFELKYIKH